MIDPEDLAAFHAAVADTEPLPPDNRVQLPRAKPRLVRRPPEQEHTPPVPGKRRDQPWPAHWQVGESKRPAPADPEEAAFRAAMAGVQPLPSPNRAHLAAKAPPPTPRQFLADEQAALHESLHGRIALQDRLEGGDEPNYLREGLAITVLRDLRRGRWVIQGEIDLHGLKRDEARHQLAGFLAQCIYHGQRCIRVIHGKGLGSPQKQSILRQLVRGWLAQRIEVLAYCQAKPHDGGEGALIVLLRAKK